MPVYMVYICHSVSDRTQLEKYWASIGPTLEGQPIKFLAGYTPFEVLEGENVLGAFVGEWPSMEAAKAWYDSPAYFLKQALRRSKRGCATGSAEGELPPSHRTRLNHRSRPWIALFT